MKALITGASRGIGRGIAVSLASRGYDLYLVCQHNISELNNLADELSNKFNIKVTCFQGDVSDSSFIKRIFEEIDSLDILINNAGISYVGLLTDMTDEEWHQTISVNLDSVFYTSKNAARMMLGKHSGHIINISSVWGSQGASMEVAYSASKGAVDSFTKALAKELAPSNIRVNAIACGLIDTDMNKHLDSSDISALIEEIPADRMGTPSDIGQMVLSLIDSPSYLTGQIIRVDGGWI